MTPTFDTAAPTSTDAPTSTPTIDTGVARPAFDSQNATLDVDVVLQTAPASSKDFAGTWSDGLGLIRVASNGVRLLASSTRLLVNGARSGRRTPRPTR